MKTTFFVGGACVLLVCAIPGPLPALAQSESTPRTAGATTAATGEPCVDNPRFNPNNDKNGPRTSEPYTDSTPYVSTPTAQFGVICPAYAPASIARGK